MSKAYIADYSELDCLRSIADAAQRGLLGGAGGGGAPSGAAGGDLGGTYPGPSVEKIAGVTPTSAFLTTVDDPTVAAMVDTLFGAASTGTTGAVRATSPTVATPVLIGTTIVRQSGGVAGTDEVQISHNGSSGLIRSMDGSLSLVAGNAEPFTISSGDGTNPALTTTYALWLGKDLRLGSNLGILWSDAISFAGTSDAGLGRGSAGTLKVTNGSSGFGALTASALSLTTGAAGDILIKQYPENTAYNMISLNGVTGAGRMGPFGRSGDPSMYTSVPTGGIHYFQVQDAGIVTISSAGLAIGAGTAITKVLSATATLDFPSTAAGTVSELTITVTGAATGDAVSIGVPPGSVPATGDFFGYVSAADTVTVRFSNNDLITARDPASGTFRVQVTKF